MNGYDPGFQNRIKVIPFLAEFTKDTQKTDPEKFIFPCPDFMTRSLLPAKTLVHNRKGEEKCSEGVVKVSNSGRRNQQLGVRVA